MRRNKILHITCEAVETRPIQLGQLSSVQREVSINACLQVTVAYAPNYGLGP